jgi:hypothetical protein
MSNTYEYVDRTDDFVEACMIAINFQKETNQGFLVFKVEEAWNTDFTKEEPPRLRVVNG